MWGIRKTIVSKSVVQYLNGLPWTILGSAPLEVYETQPNSQPIRSHAGKQVYFEQNINKMAFRNIFKTTFFYNSLTICFSGLYYKHQELFIAADSSFELLCLKFTLKRNYWFLKSKVSKQTYV